MTTLTTATRKEGVFYGLATYSILFIIGSILCATVIGIVLGVPLIVMSVWYLITCPWAYRKLRAAAFQRGLAASGGSQKRTNLLQ